MKKLIAVGATAALMMATASPAFADVSFGDDTQVLDASQVQVAVALQANTGDVNAGADDGSWADASIDQSLTIEQSQFNGGFDDDFDGFFFVD